MPHPGKREWEGTEQVRQPSEGRSETRPEQIGVKRAPKEEREGAEGKKRRVDRREEKKFRKIVAKQAKSRYYNPDPLFRLIGEANETKVKLDGTELKALIDSGSQISTVTEKLAKLMGWKIRSLKNILDIEGTGGVRVKYKGYVEATLGIPQVDGFEKPSLFVVISNSEYGEQVPVQIGTLHIDMILRKATPNEIATWEKPGREGR